MTIVLVFLIPVAGVALWWLSRQHLMSKPWLETGEVTAAPHRSEVPTEKIGLGVFLAVVGGLFALFGSALVMRMEALDWYQLQLPSILWLNTAVLVVSSAFLHAAVHAARRGDAGRVEGCVVAAGITTLAFLGGQLLAWRMLMSDGQGLSGSPGASFFYLITAMHGLHIVGGLVGLARVAWRLDGRGDAAGARLGVELCATYWHFLLAVWVGIFALLLGWGSDLAELCRAALS